MGRGDKKFADQVAVASMRRMLNKLDMKGIIKIGEGERDEAPMLYIGEQVGTGKGDLKLILQSIPWREQTFVPTAVRVLLRLWPWPREGEFPRS